MKFWGVLLFETVGCYVVMLLCCYVVMLLCFYVVMLLCCFLFRCDKCEKYYPPKYLATRHILVHQEGKNFKCKVCEKSFKTPENLKVEHILIIGQTSKFTSGWSTSFVYICLENMWNNLCHLTQKKCLAKILFFVFCSKEILTWPA